MVVRRLQYLWQRRLIRWVETGTDTSTSDCFQPLVIVSGGKAPPCTRCVAQNRLLWGCWLWVALRTVSVASQKWWWWWWWWWWKSRVLSRFREIFIEPLNKRIHRIFFFNDRKFCEILHYSLIVRILENSNFT